MDVQLDLRLPGGFKAASAARQSLDGLSKRVRSDVLEDIRLLVNELVTNSVRHARIPHGSWINLRVDVGSEVVRVEVTDPGPGFELAEPRPSLASASGWGLYLVERMADRWGVDLNEHTTVWFEIDCEPA